MTTARNVFWVICRKTYPIRAGWAIRHGAGSWATAGHQNRSAAPRNRACSRSWTSGSSSAASNSGEKWLAHITPAKTTQATTGKASTRMTREWRTGRIQRRRASGRRDAQEQRDRSGQGDERGGDQHQQDVLDHVDGEQRRVVALDAREQRERDGQHPQAERDRPPARDRVRRMRPVDPADRPPPHGRAVSAMPSVGSGSNVQPSSSVASGRRLGRDRSVGGHGRQPSEQPRTDHGRAGEPLRRSGSSDGPSAASSHESARGPSSRPRDGTPTLRVSWPRPTAGCLTAT